MCSPKAPKVEPVKQETIAAPTIADASVQRAGSAQKNKTAALAKKDIKTTARGLGFAIDLGIELVRLLIDEEAAESVKAKIQYC